MSHGYEQMKALANARNKEASSKGRDIGELPSVVNAWRKSHSRRNFRMFCERYFPERFRLRWSPDHLAVIKKIEAAVLQGGLFAMAMPRGSGKTALSEAAAIWALLYGHREFVVLVGSTEGGAVEILDSIKTELESNSLLSEDFPEVCYPIKKLEGIANRCAGQLYKGVRTKITWTANEIVLPTIEGSIASGVIVRVAGITGRIRGMKYTMQDGRSIRPSLVLVDDPQTSESAGSEEQTKKRVRVLAGDILGLAGPGQKISGIMPCTIIRADDMAAQILDRKRHPDWNGTIAKMLYEFPSDMKLWEQYGEIWADSLRELGNISKATKFYRANRKAMDAGARVGWEDNYYTEELSALQHAMNLRLRDVGAFMAEYQNDPLPDDLGDEAILSEDDIAAKTNNLSAGTVPLDSSYITMFVDIQKTLLYYLVSAWSPDFTGVVLEYGAWPKQRRADFEARGASPVFADVFPNVGLEGQIYQGLSSLLSERMGAVYRREDGAEMKLDLALVDANWGSSTDVVYQFARQTDYSGRVYPAHGRYIGADSRPMTEYRRERGGRLGFNWMMPAISGKRSVRHVVFDANFWKSFIHERLSVPLGDSGSLTLPGSDPRTHLPLARHLTAEFRVRTIGRGRQVDEWRLKPHRGDNHWLDCLSGSAVAASMIGAARPEHLVSRGVCKASTVKIPDKAAGNYPDSQAKPASKSISMAELQRVKRGSRSQQHSGTAAKEW